MQYKQLATLILCLLLHSVLSAQSVLYSPTISNDINTRFEVIGKAGNFYWLNKIRKNSSYKNGVASYPNEDRSFEVYDRKLKRVKEIDRPLADSVLKEYLIPQKASFDHLIFTKSLNKTSVVVNRFKQDGDGAVRNAHLFDFPANLAIEDLLVTRSPDRTKILLLGFVRGSKVTPDLYARVYTTDWELLHQKVYSEGNLLQPLIQYERTEKVLESSDASPVKIINNGDWLMVAPSRFRNNYVLCHFKSEDSSFSQVDIQQLQNPGIEHFSLSVEEGGAYVGILENLTPSDKRLRMVQYNLLQNRLSHDTTYNFHFPISKNEGYQYEETLIQIPGKGFMFMKEYGRRYYINYLGEHVLLDNEQEYAAYANQPTKLKLNKYEYTRNSNLADAKKRFGRGDLSVKYFPFHTADSGWGGLIQVDQSTELRYGELSYACVPSTDKIIFLYNSLAKNEFKVSSSTILNHKGQAMDEGVIFWKSGNVLDFQKARLILPGEIFIPFDRNTFQGFAIIHF